MPNTFSPLIDELIQSLRCLPGVGPKSAQRMAFHLIEREKENALKLSDTIKRTIDGVGHCNVCRTLTENAVCRICSDPKRNAELLCIVESPADILAVENTNHFRGKYFVLMGHLSPLDGIGPEELGLSDLKERLSKNNFAEIILATNPTVEGEATAHYLSQLIKPFGIKLSRIAHGVPLGGELEFIDNHTLTHAISSRETIET